MKQNTILNKFAFIAVVITASLFIYKHFLNKEDCSLKALQLVESPLVAEQLFFSGTCYFRNKEFSKAAAHWDELLQLENTRTDREDFRTSTLNNLGYLYFFGFGVKEDKSRAVEYWQQAALSGHHEAEYHLCHAHAEKEEPTYDVVKARNHCKKALLIYHQKTKSNDRILSDLENYNSALNNDNLTN